MKYFDKLIATIAAMVGACLDSTQKCGDGKCRIEGRPILRCPQAVASEHSGNFYLANTSDQREPLRGLVHEIH